MGVYIKGMAMPETKFECEFWNTDHVCTANMDGVACDPADGIYLPENCPLVEVAEPHGRLIDTDALLGKCRDWYVEESLESGFGFIGTLKRLLDGQSAVIEEENE